MFYKECPHCGANLDPGEKCDCTEKEKACTGGAVQTSWQTPFQNSLNYTTKGAECQYAKHNAS